MMILAGICLTLIPHKVNTSKQVFNTYPIVFLITIPEKNLEVTNHDP